MLQLLVYGKREVKCCKDKYIMAFNIAALKIDGRKNPKICLENWHAAYSDFIRKIYCTLVSFTDIVLFIVRMLRIATNLCSIMKTIDIL